MKRSSEWRWGDDPDRVVRLAGYVHEETACPGKRERPARWRAGHPEQGHTGGAGRQHGDAGHGFQSRGRRCAAGAGGRGIRRVPAPPVPGRAAYAAGAGGPTGTRGLLEGRRHPDAPGGRATTPGQAVRHPAGGLRDRLGGLLDAAPHGHGGGVWQESGELRGGYGPQGAQQQLDPKQPAEVSPRPILAGKSRRLSLRLLLVLAGSGRGLVW